MSLDNNEFKNTNIFGIFQNVDDTINSINASSYFQRNLEIEETKIL